MIARTAMAFCIAFFLPAATRAEKEPVFALVGARLVTEQFKGRP